MAWSAVERAAAAEEKGENCEIPEVEYYNKGVGRLGSTERTAEGLLPWGGNKDDSGVGHWRNLWVVCVKRRQPEHHCTAGKISLHPLGSTLGVSRRSESEYLPLYTS